MIEIDGSMGEGGGQVVRTAVALSALTGKPCRIFNMRAGRCEPGLRPQHLAGVNAVAGMCNAKTKGAAVGSSELLFEPGKLHADAEKTYAWDVGTAGAASLVLQSVMIPAAFCGAGFGITGGTNVRWSPPVDYLQHVTLPCLLMMGYDATMEIARRGFYPKGGGLVKGAIRPCGKLEPLALTEPPKTKRISGVSACANLPEDVALRQAQAAATVLRENGYDADIRTEVSKAACPGSAIILWVDGSAIGADALGERGKPAEAVGSEAAEKLVLELRSGCAVDRHMVDQLVPYMALADGTSEITAPEMTMHAATNIEVVKKFIGADFSTTDGRIRVRGAGFGL